LLSGVACREISMRESTDLQPAKTEARADDATAFAPVAPASNAPASNAPASNAPASNAPASNAATTRMSWPHLVLGALGFAISFGSLVVHNRLKAGQATGCDFSETINCESVLSSQYGTLFHVPWGVWGMAFFVVVLLGASAKEANVADRARTAAWRLAVASGGIATSIALTYVSKVLIGAFCPICIATHAATVSLFVVSLIAFLKARKARNNLPPAA